MAGFDISDYVDVAERIAEFRTKHPEGSLQQVGLEFRSFAGKDWVVFTAAAYRSPDDPRPGHGTAWEPVPGRTPYTRDSELQNAETAAWGRAIVAVLAADTKRGVASAQEVRSRVEERNQPPQQQARQTAQQEHLVQTKSDINADKARIWRHARGKSNDEKKSWVGAAFAARDLSADKADDVAKLADELDRMES